MLRTQRWQRWLLVALVMAACSLPQVAWAQRRGRNIPFVITAMGPIRKSDYYAHLMTPEQRLAQRKIEDAYLEQMRKRATPSQPQPSTPRK